MSGFTKQQEEHLEKMFSGQLTNLQSGSINLLNNRISLKNLIITILILVLGFAGGLYAFCIVQLNSRHIHETTKTEILHEITIENIKHEYNNKG